MEGGGSETGVEPSTDGMASQVAAAPPAALAHSAGPSVPTLHPWQRPVFIPPQTQDSDAVLAEGLGSRVMRLFPRKNVQRKDLHHGLQRVQSSSCLTTHTCQSTSPAFSRASCHLPCFPSKRYQKTRCLEKVPMLTIAAMPPEEAETVQRIDKN